MRPARPWRYNPRMTANQQKATLTTTGQQMEMGCSWGPSYGDTHVWQVHNNSTSNAVVRPQGSLLESGDVDAADFWTDLGASDLTVAAGATGTVTITGEPRARVRLNVKTLADNNIIVVQSSHASS